jgi:DNA adenine methylase
VFFALQPAEAILADTNDELVICLKTVRDAPRAVMSSLDRMPNTPAFFESVRRQDTRMLGDVGRAARLIYLNKTAFRGLWRVNRRGEFNTPYGQYRRPYYNVETLLDAALALRGVDIRCADFEEVLGEGKRGDWVYVDPPYVPDRKWGDFTRYTAGQFGVQDQERLASQLCELDRRGVRWLLTNSNTKIVRELYRGYRMSILSTRRDITLQAADRQSCDLVVSNYEPTAHPGLKSAHKSRG